MGVPKASVNKYNFAPGHEYKVGISREVSSVEPIAVAHAVSEPAHSHLRCGVRSLECSHHLRALFRALSHSVPTVEIYCAFYQFLLVRIHYLPVSGPPDGQLECWVTAL
jgi:hypothetical protein